MTAAGQLAVASEFRFDYWHTQSEHKFYTVRRGVKGYEAGWAISDGGASGPFWDGAGWNDDIRGEDAYRYELEDALLIARRLAFAENQHIIGIMENQFPGQFRGTRIDQVGGRHV